ncbi:hypothetical protein PENANT_c033G05358 [Penicillium antarcticum]|uniref:DUF7779 domain-containing protein n=1 Tax=Penicillium antarcticum TaxID=416450 RepID=A0A1V6PUH5_9EURO|nr:uncharacterized protein N7508_000894 [Penicillium antarcticum]KAJ5320611.1 hypothetical protein N7508_000894 [Penicillium antarcticum]OQD80699.1 hypothetical protein PENANT_c033G05358 [Penicillium antarcticum]
MTSISFGYQNSGFQVGISHGPIYLPADQPEPRPEPLSTVPFPHDPDFVSRDELLDQIHEKSSIPGARIVLFGLGGVGKSRLAIEYCHQVWQQSPDTWIFWVHASNAARCEESLRNLADRAKVPGRQDRNANIFQLFGNWLQDGEIGEWILVLDNVDDDELLCKPLATRIEAQADAQYYTSTRPPLRYLLESSNGSIIMTSRNKAVALEIAGDKKNLIDVQPMNTAEASVLMQKKLDSSTEEEDLVLLVEELEFMPLAIVQAASYITHRSPRCSASEYLEKLRQSDHQASKLLYHEGKHMHRDWQAKNSILLTWQISFDHIRRIRRSAADLLSLMSFFDWQGIQENLLRVQDAERDREPLGSPEGVIDRSSEEHADSSSDCDLDDDFESDIATLRDYSFIATGEDNMVFTMHRLVQLTVRTWLKSHGQEEQWKELFISSLCGEFPTGEYENWDRCRSLFPHIRSAVLHRPKSQDSLRNWAALLYRGAWYAQECGNISTSKEMAEMSRKQRLKIGGAEDEDTLNSTAMLAVAYRLEGRWHEAEQLEVQVIETRKTKLGADHPSTLTSIANLAFTLWNQGRWEEAEQLEMQVIETRKTKLGADHPDTLTSIGNLASTLWNQGRWEEAEQLFVQVIETRKTKLGADHPNTLTSMANLALTLWNQGRWEEAEQLEVHVMETRKTKLGVDHPDTLTSIGNLAFTLWNQGRWEEAEQLFMHVIETSKTKLGAEHPSTLTSMANLAFTLWNQGRWEEAEQLFMHVIETRKTKLGVEHPSTLTSIANLAATYRNQGRWEAAEQLFVQVIETSKTKLGADHPDTLTSIGNLAVTYRDQGRWEEAEQLLVQVMETRKTKLGADHPDTLTSMANLAFTWESAGRSTEAIDLLRTCVIKQERSLGPTHPYTLHNSETLLNWETRHVAI